MRLSCFSQMAWLRGTLTQHMPATFTSILADHITRSTGWTCVEATDGMPVQSGRVHLARVP